MRSWLLRWMSGHDASGRSPAGGMPAPDPSIPRWLRDLADRHGYEIRELLGRGGQGWVYLAYDRRHREMVALKTMRYIDAARLMRLLSASSTTPADLRHHNLVRLYELISDGEDWFFTMELVKGTRLPGVRPLRCG